LRMHFSAISSFFRFLRRRASYDLPYTNPPPPSPQGLGMDVLEKASLVAPSFPVPSPPLTCDLPLILPFSQSLFPGPPGARVWSTSQIMRSSFFPGSWPSLSPSSFFFLTFPPPPVDLLFLAEAVRSRDGTPATAAIPHFFPLHPPSSLPPRDHLPPPLPDFLPRVGVPG